MKHKNLLIKNILFFTFCILANSKLIEVSGYSSFHKLIRIENKCFKANSKVSNIKSYIEINQSMDYNTMENTLKSLVKSEAYLFFENYKSTKFLQTISHHIYQLNYLLKNEFEVDFSPVSVGEGILTEFGKEVFRNNNKYFQTYCGDFFIQKALIKSVLAINVSFHTNSYDDYLKLTKGSNINFLGLKDVISQISNAVSNSKISGSMNFEVYQVGGISSRLEAFLASVDSTKSLFSKQCEFGNLNSCFAFVDKLIDYGSHDFPNQIEDSFNAINLENSLILSKLNIQMLGLKFSELKPNLSIMKDLYIIKQFKEEAFCLDKKMKYILSYLEQRPLFRPAAIPVAQEFLEIAKINLSLFESGSYTYSQLVNCADLPYNCEEARISLESVFIKVFRWDAFPKVFEGLINNCWNDERYSIPSCFECIYPSSEY